MRAPGEVQLCRYAVQGRGQEKHFTFAFPKYWASVDEDIMIAQCPNCGEIVEIKGLGRKPLNIPLKNICEALNKHHSVVTAAQELGCSPAYIFRVLKVSGLQMSSIIKGQKYLQIRLSKIIAMLTVLHPET